MTSRLINRVGLDLKASSTIKALAQGLITRNKIKFIHHENCPNMETESLLQKNDNSYDVHIEDPRSPRPLRNDSCDLIQVTNNKSNKVSPNEIGLVRTETSILNELGLVRTESFITCAICNIKHTTISLNCDKCGRQLSSQDRSLMRFLNLKSS